MKKRIFSVVVVLSCLTLVGCGAKMNAASNTESVSVQDTDTVEPEPANPVEETTVEDSKDEPEWMHAAPVDVSDIPVPKPESELNSESVSNGDRTYTWEPDEELLAEIEEFYKTNEDFGPQKYVKNGGKEVIVVENFLAPGMFITATDANGNTFKFPIEGLADSYYCAMRGDEAVIYLDIADGKMVCDMTSEMYSDFYGHYTLDK